MWTARRCQHYLPKLIWKVLKRKMKHTYTHREKKRRTVRVRMCSFQTCWSWVVGEICISRNRQFRVYRSAPFQNWTTEFHTKFSVRTKHFALNFKNVFANSSSFSFIQATLIQKNILSFWKSICIRSTNSLLKHNE